MNLDRGACSFHMGYVYSGGGWAIVSMCLKFKNPAGVNWGDGLDALGLADNFRHWARTSNIVDISRAVLACSN